MPAPSLNSPNDFTLAVIGGGPAGFFAALTAKQANPACRVVILEKSAKVLGKVKISGGGRCNITHDCPDPRQLAGYYPRGHRELIGSFTRFGTDDAIAWFTKRGVSLRTYPDGCLFPQSNSSQSVIDCLVGEANHLGIEVRPRSAVTKIASPNGKFTLETPNGPFIADKVLIATGGKSQAARCLGPYTPTGGYALAAGLGHSTKTPVPSLFTFIVNDPLLQDLMGIVVDPVQVRVKSIPSQPKALRNLKPQDGPLLITHWGVSGPAVLKLSAWGAREFHNAGYRFTMAVDWVPSHTGSELEQTLKDQQQTHPAKRIRAFGLWNISRRLWERLIDRAAIPKDRRWGELGRKQRDQLVHGLKETELEVSGQSTFKDEFVTCGGVPLQEVDLRSMQSRRTPGLFFAGEVLDIDGVTGGFNFQACWTTGYIAGKAVAATGEKGP